MDNKKIIILDTNYIIANKNDFKKKVEELTEKFDLYIPEVCIHERIGQQFVELNDKYDEIKMFEEKHKHYIEIKFKKDLSNLAEKIENTVNESYKSLNNVKFIPIDKEGKMYEDTMVRACRKMAPFSKDKNASDKGFKDALLWVSLLYYFKDNESGKEIILVTNDSSFEKRSEELKAEFLEITGKNIEFRDNSYTREMLGESIIKPHILEQNEIINISHSEIKELRDELAIVLSDIYYEEDEDDWGESYLLDRFSLKCKISNDDVLNLLSRLKTLIDENILDSHINPSEIFKDICELETKYPIPIEKLEKINELWIKVQDRYRSIQDQFLKRIVDFMNERIVPSVDIDDVPF